MPRGGINHLRRRARTYFRQANETTEVLRSVTTETEPGYPRTADAVVATVKSWGAPLGQREALQANQANYLVDGRRFLPVGTDVRPTDRLRVGGKVYQVAGVVETTPDFAPYTEVLVSRTDNP